MILLLLLILASLLYAALLQRRIEEMLPVYASVAVLVCYILAVFQALQWFVWIIAALAAYAAARLTAQIAVGKGGAVARAFRQSVFTPGLVCFALITVWYVAAAAPHRVTHTDEIYVWGLQPLSIFYHNGFVNAAHQLSPQFMTYMPGMHLFQWIGLAINGAWNEGTLFLWLWLLYAVLLMPLTAGLTWKKGWRIPLYAVGIVLVPAVFNGEAYRILRVDTVVGLCLGYSAIQAWKLATLPERRFLNGLSLSLSLSLLVLLKQPGIGWALFALALLLLAGAPKYGGRRMFRETLRVFVLPLLVFLSWVIFCRAAGLHGIHTTALADNTEKILEGTQSVSGDLPSILAGLAATLLRGSPGMGGLALPQAAWLAVALLLPLLLWRSGRLDAGTAKRLGFWIAAGYLLFFCAFTVALFTSFRAEWTSPVDQTAIQPLLANLLRYGCALWYALLMLFAFIALQGRPNLAFAAQPGRRAALPVFAALLCALLMLGVNWSTLTQNLAPGRYPGSELTPKLEELASASFWTDDIDDPADAVVLLASDSYPNNRGWLQYALAPIKLVMPFTSDWTGDAFVALLRDNDIQYFVSEGTENPLYRIACEYAESGEIDDYTVYAVEWNNGVPSLV
ncbi:MAG: hypothetical protein PHY64_02320 [Eubacteriales bacterium]|nr:hypothetical protein [Eubacteriales bacterium]